MIADPTPWLYYGCLRPPDYGLYDVDLNPVRDLRFAKLTRFDGLLAPQPERDDHLYQAALTRLGGWGFVALSWWDRSVDRRPGANGIVFTPAGIDPEAALELARRTFPAIFNRQPRAIVLAR